MIVLFLISYPQVPQLCWQSPSCAGCTWVGSLEEKQQCQRKLLGYGSPLLGEFAGMDMGGVCHNTDKPCMPPFSCRGLLFLLMECEVCAKLLLDARLPQRRQKVLRAGSRPCRTSRWRWPYGRGERALRGVPQQMFDSTLVAKSLKCQPAPVT